MRQIEQRQAVIGPGAIVRMKKEAARAIKDLMARWRVLGAEGELVRVENAEDPDDTRTFTLEQIERVSGGPEQVVSLIAGEPPYTLVCPEHEDWPACIRYERATFLRGPSAEFEGGCLFDDPEDITLDDEDDPDCEDV